MKFTKMHGLGNDYLYVKADALPADAAELSVKYSDRHMGVGSDGIIWILPSDVADARMHIFNADGSEARMCGNGIRCVGKYLHDRGFVPQGTQLLHVDTLSGVKELDLTFDACGHVSSVSVDMGVAVVNAPLQLPEQGLSCVPVDVGNPHAVIFCEDAEAVPLAQLGPAIEHSPLFPGGVNVEFVQVMGSQELRMRVWERGSGITMACGTGSCASVAAAVAWGHCPDGEPVTVHLDGGDLLVSVDEGGRVTMTGPATFICDGETLD